MPAIARADLESLLRLKKLDHTLTTALEPPLEPINGRWLVPTGIADLDERLQGGFPRGQMSEVVGGRSSGRLAVMVSTLAGATRRGEAVAYIDPLDMFDPASAAASGIDFSRLLWIRGEAATSSARVSLSCEYGTLQKSLDRAVKALNLVLQAGGFGLVVLDLAEVPPQVLRRLPVHHLASAASRDRRQRHGVRADGSRADGAQRRGSDGASGAASGFRAQASGTPPGLESGAEA